MPRIIRMEKWLGVSYTIFECALLGTTVSIFESVTCLEYIDARSDRMLTLWRPCMVASSFGVPEGSYARREIGL
jgi:hypothetical protein